jgi:ribonuclease P protein component
VIARKNRFRGHNSVSKVRGKPVHLQGFKIFSAKNHRRQDYRMAVVVSKKTAKSAVTRNRIRRRFYEAVRKERLAENKPLDLVFVVQDPNLAKTDWAELVSEVRKGFKKITDQS